jgi:hypothetical protein
VITEILGEPAAQMRNPVNAGYQCPFLSSTCIKTSQRIAGPYSVCTVYYGGGASRVGVRPICVCPKRLYAIDLVADVLKHCWPPGTPPQNPQIAYEVKMANFGNVDMVIADIDPATGAVGTFVSVELQAVDITGSVEPAYQGVLNSQPVVDVSYGINWANVRKRFITQLINKAFYHVHWGMRLVAVLQTPLYNRLHEAIRFDELPPNTGGNTVIFMLYDYVPDPARPGAYVLELDRVVGTSHNSLMTASLYQLVPSKEVFHERILANLAR